MEWSTKILLIVSTIVPCAIFAQGVSHEAQVLRGLGWKFATFVYSQDKFIAKEYVKSSNKVGIRAYSVKTDEIRLQDNLVFVEDTLESWQALAELLEQRILSAESVVIISDDLSVWEHFENFFRDLNCPSSFFRLTKLNGTFRLWHILTFQNQNLIAANEWTYEESTGSFREEYDLKGGVLSTIGSEYPPELYIYDCDDDNKNCKNSGAFIDIIQRLGQMLNFTFTVAKDPDGFGSVPVSGSWYDSNARFKGAFAKTIDGTYDICGSLWTFIHQRVHWVDFSQLTVFKTSVVIGPQGKENYDFNLFLRPFSKKSWIAFAAITIFGFSVNMLVSKVNICSTDTSRWLSWTLWTCFALISAYYSGALTMFFSTPLPKPFSTINEGLKLYPDWKFIILKTNLIIVQKHADAGDEDFQKYLQLSQTDEELIQDRPEDLLKLLMRPGYFAAIQLHFLSDVWKHHEMPDAYIEELFKVQRTPMAIIYPRKSPLKKIISKAILHFRERGFVEVIWKHWFGKPPLKSQTSTAIHVLGMKDLILIFALFGASLAISFLLLTIEKLVKWIAPM